MLDLNVKDKLKKLRNVCTNQKIVLIFDEIITGFRFPQYCVSNHFGITPDIICLGKAIAGGHPLSVVGGKKKYMNTPDYFISSTFAGETTSIREALLTLDLLSVDKLQELWDRGKWFRSEFNKISPKIQLNGYPTRSVWQAEETYKAIFWQEMLKRGYLFGKAFFLMFSHTEEILKKTLKDSKEVINNMDNYKLEGDLPKEVFKRN
jgi:glutamate-1-semialdehyde aminotransferase